MYSAIIIILDGCNVHSLKKAKMSCIKNIAKIGSSTFKCKSVLPSVTYTAHASIVTGVYPRDHGIVGNCFYDRMFNKIVDFDNVDVNKYLLSKTLMEEVKGVKLCIGEPFTKGCTIVVSKKEVQSRRLFEQDIYALEEAIRLVKTYKPVLTVLNLPGVDGIGETYGPLSRELISHLEKIDELICKLVNTVEEIYEDYLLLVVADHGMASVTEKVDLDKALDDIPAITCVSHRSAHIYLPSELDAEKIIERLERQNIFEYIVGKHSLNTFNLDHARSGDIVVFAVEGYELGYKGLRGSHGGLSKDEYYVPLIVNKPEYSDLLVDPDITVVPRIVFRYLNEKEALKIADKYLRRIDPAHGIPHTLRVLKLSTELALRYHADVEAVRLASIFHDTGKGVSQEKHELNSADIAEEFLRGKRYSKIFRDKVRRIIIRHHDKPESLETIEERIIWDADKLDAIGLTGLFRCLIEAGFNKGTIYDAIEHARRDLNEFKDKMHFPETAKLAEIKERNMLNCLRRFERELRTTFREVD